MELSRQENFSSPITSARTLQPAMAALPLISPSTKRQKIERDMMNKDTSPTSPPPMPDLMSNEKDKRGAADPRVIDLTAASNSNRDDDIRNKKSEELSIAQFLASLQEGRSPV